MKRFLYLTCSLLLCLSTALWFGCKENEVQLPGSIHGFITDMATGEPIKTAGVELQPSGEKTVTGTDGQYEFPEVDPGIYKLYITKTGYKEKISSEIVVRAAKASPRNEAIEKLPQSLRIVGGDGKDIDTLDFGAEEDVDSRTFSIFNDGPTGLTWWIDESCPWISSVKSMISNNSSGKLEAGIQEPIRVAIDRAALGQGRKSYILNINSDNGSKELTVMATGATLAVSNVLSVTNVTKNTAVFNGSVEEPGHPAYTERGFVYAETTNPTVSDNKISVQLTESKDFSALVEGLSVGKTYYVKTYMINSAGISYSSNEVKFTTITASTVVETKPVSEINISEKTVMLNGTISEKGTPPFSERGFMYSFREDMEESSKLEETGTSEGDFSLKLSNIQLGTNYYVRAYAIQGGMYIYGNVVGFSGTMQEPVLNTSSATNISATSATLNASISVVGDPAYTERGFCYSKTNNPTISDYRKTVDGSGLGTYSVEINNLEYKTTYYVRAYVLQEGKPIYGDCVSFTTIWTEAELRTLAPTNVRSSSVTLNAEISEIGSPHFIEKGFCYSKSYNPTISDIRKVVPGEGRGPYSIDITGLDYQTTYYVRAYLIQGGQPIYGENVALTTTWTDVEVRTFAATDIEAESAILRGELVNPGDPVCTEYGFVYSSSRTEPIISDKKIMFTSIQTTYSSLLENLTENTTYYVRTYAVQSGKVFYGDVTQFQTGTVPRVETLEVDGVYKMGQMSGGGIYAILQGNVLSAGNPEYVERGFVYAVEDVLYNTPPTYENDRHVSAPTTGTGVYTGSTTSLKIYEWYVMRAYVKMRSGKIYYGGVVKFDTWTWQDLGNL